MSTIDSTDGRIARLLGQNARQNSEALAKQLNLSSATVRRRLRKLIREDVIHIVAVADPIKLGFPVAVVMTLNVAHDKIESTMEMLAKRPEIRWVSATTGRFDIIALARLHSNNDLSEFMTKVLAQLKGLKESETFLCLDIKKGRYIQFIPP